MRGLISSNGSGEHAHPIICQEDRPEACGHVQAERKQGRRSLFMLTKCFFFQSTYNRRKFGFFILPCCMMYDWNQMYLADVLEIAFYLKYIGLARINTPTC